MFFLASQNDFQRALQLFEKLQEEVVHPHPETVQLLQNLLKRNNQPLPLSLISKSSSEISPAAAEATKTFLELLKAGNSEAALKELSSLKKGYIRTLPVNSLTDLVDLCLQKNCTHGERNFNYSKVILKECIVIYKMENRLEIGLHAITRSQLATNSYSWQLATVS